MADLIKRFAIAFCMALAVATLVRVIGSKAQIFGQEQFLAGWMACYVFQSVMRRSAL